MKTAAARAGMGGDHTVHAETGVAAVQDLGAVGVVEDGGDATVQEDGQAALAGSQHAEFDLLLVVAAHQPGADQAGESASGAPGFAGGRFAHQSQQGLQHRDRGRLRGDRIRIPVRDDHHDAVDPGHQVGARDDLRAGAHTTRPPL
ncbi:hypothetical protein [Nocardia crassostreae]|uniref:hypothetical protein n=1 Tax=Nocardia crassostreae TaxID=53428 RepID=UPI00082BC6F4|nr:hypothetical protein [Nocardia crassostreae]